MGERIPEIDAYIAKAEPFARPILTHLRKLAHAAEPAAVEAMRWGAPFLILEGRQLCGFAAFKRHCGFIVEPDGADTAAMGNFGRIAALEDLPSDSHIMAILKDKAARIRSGEDAEAARQRALSAKAGSPTPEDLVHALAQVPQAQAVFDGFTGAQQRDYSEWITSAKRDVTRAQRVATAVEWISQGKRRNWKYEKC